jgi:hypothetical protein
MPDRIPPWRIQASPFISTFKNNYFPLTTLKKCK